MKRRLLLVIPLLLLLSGCMFSEANLVENQLPPEEWMEQVQRAVDGYRQDSGGLLPILTKGAEVPIYEKYPLDFGLLVPKYLFTVPNNAFEKEGGTHRYILIDVEENPEVKLIDLKVTEAVGNVQRAVRAYFAVNGHLPIAELRQYGFFSVDYTKLHVGEVLVKSPFSGVHLPLLMDRYGRVGVDYALDIQQLLDEQKVAPQGDLRELLYRSSWFVPADSFPYLLQDGEPVPQLDPAPQS